MKKYLILPFKKSLILFLILLFIFTLFLKPKITNGWEIKFFYNLGENEFVINGRKVSFSSEPLIVNGRVTFPLRDITNILDIEIKWNKEEKGIELFSNKNKIKLLIGKDFYYYDNEKKPILIKPFIYKNLTYIGIRDFTDILNLKIKWDEINKSILISGNIYPVTRIKDDLGSEITFYEKPKRIISLAPSNTEILFSLGLNKEIIGVTEYCDYPDDAKKKEKIGGFSNPNLEKIYTLKPDFVFGIRGNPKDTLINLKKLNINVLAFDPKNVDELFDLILKIGKLVDKREEANNLVSGMKEKKDLIIKKSESLKKKKVYLEIWNNPYMSVGENTYLNNLIEEVGGINIAKKAKGDWPILSQESIITENPEVIIIAYMGQNIEEILNRPGWENIDAVKNKRIYYINPDLIFRLGPRIIDGMEELFNLIHKDELLNNKKGLSIDYNKSLFYTNFINLERKIHIKDIK
ncbi:MAG: helical backbone metal receptor [Caldisericia bacterium]